MPRIDPLLTAMVSNGADSVRLSDGEIAHIVKDGTQHPLTRQPLGDGQLMLLLREMVPPEVAGRLGGTEPLEFSFTNSDGRFLARVMRENGTLRAMVRSDDSLPQNGHETSVPQSRPQVAPQNGLDVSASNGHEPMPQNGGAVAASPETAATARAAPVAARVGDTVARTEVDGLLRMLVQE